MKFLSATTMESLSIQREVLYNYVCGEIVPTLDLVVVYLIFRVCLDNTYFLENENLLLKVL